MVRGEETLETNLRLYISSFSTFLLLRIDSQKKIEDLLMSHRNQSNFILKLRSLKKTSTFHFDSKKN